MMGKQRVLYIDLLKFIAILFVTWGHTMGQYGTHTDVSNWLTSWRFTIDMPLFAILSGLFFRVPENMELWPMLKKKILSLLIPNVVWCFLFYIAMHGLYMAVQLLCGSGEVYQGSLLWDWWYAMWYEGWWFLRSLLFVFIYAICSVYIVRRIGIRRHSMLIAGLGSSVFLYALSLLGVVPNHHSILIGAIYLYPFVWTGVVIKIVDKHIAEHLWLVFVASMCVWSAGLFYWDNAYAFYGMNTSIFATGQGVTGMNVLWVTLYRFCIGIVASLSVISLIRILFGKTLHGDSKLLDYLVDIGKYTLFIYIAPSFLFHFVKQRVVFEGEMASFFFCTLTSIVIIIVCYWLAKIIDQWKWTRRLLLGVWK